MDPVTRVKTLDAEDPEESGLRRPGDYKQKQVFEGTQLLFLAYQSIGTASSLLRYTQQANMRQV